MYISRYISREKNDKKQRADNNYYTLLCHCRDYCHGCEPF